MSFTLALLLVVFPGSNVPFPVAIIAGSIAVFDKPAFLSGLKWSNIIGIIKDASSFYEFIIFEPALK